LHRVAEDAGGRVVVLPRHAADDVDGAGEVIDRFALSEEIGKRGGPTGRRAVELGVVRFREPQFDPGESAHPETVEEGSNVLMVDHQFRPFGV
jgi:hypothetical protein